MMNNANRIIYYWIAGHMGKDGLCTTKKTIAQHTGFAVTTVQKAITFFKQEKIFDVENSGGHILFLRDISQCEHYELDDSTYYLCSVRYICDDVKYYEPEHMPEEPLISIAFNTEGVF